MTEKKSTPWGRMTWLALVSALAAASAYAQAKPVGQWDFDNGNLNSSLSGGQPLTFLDASTQSGTTFGTTTSFGIPDIGAAPAKVMKFAGFTLPSGYGMPVAASPNGGGGLLNDYTIVWDLFFPFSSDKKFRALLDADAGVIDQDAEFFVGTNDGIGINQDYAGNVTPNQWHRIAVVIDGENNVMRRYIDGTFVGSVDLGSQGGIDGRWALSPTTGGTLFNDNNGEVAPGYVNSIQLWDSELNTGQILALGGPSAAGIPQTIPPIPAYIDSATPASGAQNALPQPDITVVLNSGDSTVVSPKLYLDNAAVNATVTPSGSSFTLDYQAPNTLPPQSSHKVSVVFTENGTVKTNSYTFSILNYQNVNLPAPLYLETFDELTPADQPVLPDGWTSTNRTVVQNDAFDLTDPKSDTYLSFVVISKDTLSTIGGTDGGARRLKQPPIMLNGQLIDNLAEGNLLYADSDQRTGTGGQLQVVFTKDYDLTGKSNIFVAFNSLYEQNQDNMDALEYSIDHGQTWLPLLYMMTEFNDTSDVIRKSDGTVDVNATFNTARDDQAYNLPFSAFIGAPVTDALAPFVSGRYNDEADLPAEQNYSKRIEVLRAAQADNQPAVRFRFVQAGTSSWYWGIDNFGLYQINFPVIATPPQSATVVYGGTANFKVVASGAGTLSYQWLFNGNPITGATNDTLAVSNVTGDSAGNYSVTVRNADGPTTSSPAVLTVIVLPDVTTQPQPALLSVGAPVSFGVAVRGQTPFTYQWQRNDTNIPGATSATFSIPAVQASDAGNYSVVISNPTGSSSSVTAALKVQALIPITQDLVIHFPLDSDTKDTSGRGNDGVGQGQAEKGGTPPTFPTTGARVGTGSMHISDGQNVFLGQLPDLDFGSDVNFTYAFWVKAPAAGAWTGDPPFISNKDWDDGGKPGFALAAQDAAAGTFKDNWKAGAGPRRDSEKIGSIADGNWHHVAVVHDRTGLAWMYIDGSLRTSFPIAGDGDINALDYYICEDGTGRYGFDDDEGAHFLDVNLDDFGVWRRYLTAQEIASIYAQGLKGQDLTTASGEVVVLPPNVTAGPVSQVISPGGSATLSATADGTPPFTYQWQKNSNDIATATSATLTLNNVDASAAGDYRVIVTNSKGSSTSASAHIAVSSAATLAQDLVAYIKFDGNYTDSSGRGNNATAKGNPTLEAGKFGQAMRFTTVKDGSKIDYASLGSPTDLNFGDSTDFSVSFWMNWSSSEDDLPFISNKDWSSSGHVGWGVFSQSDGKVRVNATGTSGSKMDAKTSADDHDGNWHNVVVSFWRGFVTSIYVDGQLVNTSPMVTTGSVDAGLATNIGQDGTGQYTDGGSVQMTGLIDDVAIWRRVVTAQEASAIFTSGQAGKDLSTLTGGSGGQALTLSVVRGTGKLTLNWTGGTGPFTVQQKTSLSDATWTDVGTTSANTMDVNITGATGFFRVSGH